MTATLCFDIFTKVIDTYHISDDVDFAMKNPFEGIEGLLYHKSWIDTVQWHLEDIIRDPNINPVDALVIKRRIDKSNQDRTDMVEKVDDWFWNYFGTNNDLSCGKINTESPAWVIDRLSILALKVYHMQEQVDRTDADAAHTDKVQEKLNVLLEQKIDLSLAFNQLIDDVNEGRKYMKVYRQMKMYNDESLNPVLYKK
ncbi:MAG: hypothetical protein ACJAY9_002070 [Flavobacteriales bacterium]|jgi:hypothetical protein|tara:strand:+ start:114 stop:707 length:594 start_codon:yes stop_codon:yes gene_type:complete